MGRHWIDFGTYPTGVPSGWTKTADNGAGSWSVVNVSGVGKVLQASNTTSSPSTLTYDGANGDTGRGTAEVTVNFRMSTLPGSGSPGCGAIARAQAGSNVGYHAYTVQQATGNVALRRNISFSLGSGTFGTGTPVINTFYWMRIQASGSALRVRVWADGSAEPTGTWHIDSTDANFSDGPLGLVINNNAGVYQFRRVGIGTNGESAPTAPLSTNHTAAASLNLSNTLALAARRGVRGAATSTTAASVSLAGRIVKLGAAIFGLTTTVTASGLKAAHAKATFALGTSVALLGRSGKKGAAAVSLNVSVAASGRVDQPDQLLGSGSVSVTTSATLTGKKAVKGDASLGASVTVTSKSKLGVRAKGSILTSSFLVASVERDTWQDFLDDLTDSRLYLVEVYPYDRTQKAVLARYYSEGGFVTRPGDSIQSEDTVLSHEHVIYEALIKENLYFRRTMWRAAESGPTIGGRSIPDYGYIRFNNEEGTMDEFRNFNLDGRTVVVRLGGSRFRFNDFRPIFHGTSSSMELTEEYLTINLRSLDYKLDKPIQRNLYHGRGNCLRLNGSSGYATLGNWPSTASMAWEGWIRIKGTNAAGDAQILAWHGNNWINTGLDWYLQCSSTNGFLTLLAHRYSASGSAIQYANDCRDGVWRHVAFTITPSVMRLWIDGELIGSAVPPTLTAGTGTLTIGSIAGSNYANAEYDEVRFWSAELTQSDLRRRMKYEIGSAETALRGYWRMNGASGTTISDNSVNGAHGVFVGTGQGWAPTWTGPRDLAGVPIPLGFGHVTNATPRLIDPATLTYQFNDGPSEAVTAIYDAAGTLTPGTHYSVDLENSRFTLLTAPTDPGAITLDFQGYNLGGYITKTGDIAQAIVTRDGSLYLSEVNYDSIAYLNSIAPQPVQLYIDQERTILEVLDELFDGIGGFYTFDRNGFFFVGRLDEPSGTPAAEFTGYEILTIERLPIVLPCWRYRVAAEPNWTVQTDGLAAGVSATRRAFLSEARRIEVAEDPSVRDEHPLAADPEPVAALFSSRQDSRAEAQRRLVLYGKDRTMYRVTVKIRPFALNLNDVVRISFDRFGLESGWNGRIIGLEEKADINQVTMELWG